MLSVAAVVVTMDWRDQQQQQKQQQLAPKCLLHPVWLVPQKVVRFDVHKLSASAAARSGKLLICSRRHSAAADILARAHNPTGGGGHLKRKHLKFMPTYANFDCRLLAARQSALAQILLPTRRVAQHAPAQQNEHSIFALRTCTTTKSARAIVNSIEFESIWQQRQGKGVRSTVLDSTFSLHSRERVRARQLFTILSKLQRPKMLFSF